MHKKGTYIPELQKQSSFLVQVHVIPMLGQAPKRFSTRGNHWRTESQVVAGHMLCYVAHMLRFLDTLLMLSIYLSIHPSIHPSIYLSIHPTIYLSIHPSIHPSIYLSNLSVCLSIYLSVYLSIYLYIYIHTYTHGVTVPYLMVQSQSKPASLCILWRCWKQLRAADRCSNLQWLVNQIRNQKAFHKKMTEWNDTKFANETKHNQMQMKQRTYNANAISFILAALFWCRWCIQKNTNLVASRTRWVPGIRWWFNGNFRIQYMEVR